MSKKVAQLDAEGYFLWMTDADEHPLVPGEYILPAGTVDAEKPEPPLGHAARWGEDDWVFEPIAPAPPEKLAADARKKRDALLLESDYTQLPDAPVDAEAWEHYRQALRDVPEQEMFPEGVEWPEKP